MPTKKIKPKYRVGDRVRVRFGPQSPIATIVEYRGPLAGGPPLYRVQLEFGGTNDLFTEVPEDEITPAE